MPPKTQSAVHRALGDAFLELPPEVQNAHDNDGSRRLSGRADVIVKQGLLPRLICWAAALPREGANQPVSVDFSTDAEGVDRWVRNFSERTYKSTMSAGTGPRQGKLIERLGIFTAIFALRAEKERLTFDLDEIKAFGVRLPRFLAVRCHAFEIGDAGAFSFDITIELGIMGQLIHYRGELS